MILALAVVLLAAPTWAGVTITLTDLGSNKIAIGYDATTEAELVRALALDVTATDGNIVDIDDYAVGDDNGGYGIFPGNFSLHITVNPTTGMVDSWDDPNYTPVAPADDPGALGGLGTDGITIEMGSLYDTMAPATTGVLCTVTVSEGTTKLCVTGNAIRGNIVMENAAEVVPAEACIDLVVIPPDCFPSSFTTYTDWVNYGKPDCWCNSAVKATAKGDYQCDGDVSGAPYLTTGWRVYTDDLNILAANWKLKMAPASPAADPCADVSHKGYLTTGWRVYTDDLNILAANWKKKAGTPPTGLAGDCGLLTRPE
jgi:hypothetical protein